MKELTRTTYDTFRIQLEYFTGMLIRDFVKLPRNERIEIIVSISNDIQHWFKDHFVSVTRLNVALFLCAVMKEAAYE